MDTAVGEIKLEDRMSIDVIGQGDTDSFESTSGDTEVMPGRFFLSETEINDSTGMIVFGQDKVMIAFRARQPDAG